MMDLSLHAKKVCFYDLFIMTNWHLVKNNKKIMGQSLFTAQKMKKSLMENFIFCAMVHHRNIQSLAIEMFQIKHGKAPKIVTPKNVTSKYFYTNNATV